MARHKRRKPFFVLLTACVMSIHMMVSTAALAVETPAGYREITDAGGTGVSAAVLSVEDSSSSGENPGGPSGPGDEQDPSSPGQSIPSGYLEVTVPGSPAISTVTLAAADSNQKPKVYDYTITIHYEDRSGNEKTESSAKSAALGSKLPWEAEKLPSRTYEGQNYILSGFSATNIVTEHPEWNVADLYYILDANHDKIPDKYQNPDGTPIDSSLYDYTITYDYDQGARTEQFVLHSRPVGSLALDSIAATRKHHTNGKTETYKFIGVDAKSALVTPNAADNEATVYYTLEDTTETKPGGTNPGGTTSDGTKNPEPGDSSSSGSTGDTIGTPLPPGFPSHVPWFRPDFNDNHTSRFPANKPNDSDKKDEQDSSDAESNTGPAVNTGGSSSNDADGMDTNAGTMLDTENHWAYIMGYPDGTVGPQRNITRAEVAAIFYRLLTRESTAVYHSSTNRFSDVTERDWYNTAVSTMLNAGIVAGYEDGSFKPDSSITRAEFAAIVSRFLSSDSSAAGGFPDTQTHWAKDYIAAAAGAGWIQGYPDGTFRPNAYITRAEAAAMINRVLNRIPNADHMLSTMKTWPDNSSSAWYYEDLQEATNSHTYSKNNALSYEIWQDLIG